MGIFDAISNQYSDTRSEYDNTHHASVTHELLSGAAAFEAARAYEKHVAANGKPANHALAKELLAGFTGAAVDHLVETKGLDAWDKHKSKEHAKQQLESTLEREYGISS